MKLIVDYLMNNDFLDTQFEKTVYIYAVLLIVQVAFFIACYFSAGTDVSTQKVSGGTLRVIMSVAGIISMIISKKFYDSKISKIKVSDSNAQKLRNYRTYKVLQWILILAVSVTAIVVFALTKDYFYVVIFLFLFGYYILLRPAKQQLKAILISQSGNNSDGI